MAIKLPKDMPYIKTVMAKGKRYEYFDTGVNAFGKRIYKRLPPRDTSFGGVYASLLAARTKRQNVTPVPTIRQLSREYQLDDRYRRRASSTQDTYLIYLRMIEDQIGDAPVNQVIRRDVQELIEKMRDRAGAAKMALLVLRNMYKVALKKDWATVDPTKHVELPEGADDGDYEPWPDELLKEALADEEVGFPVALLYFTGQRIGDVCKMRWDDEQADNTIYVCQEKTGREVWPPIHSGLRAWLDVTPHSVETMLHGPKGRPRRKATLRGQLQKWAKARGFAVVPHGLRKNAVNALLEAGCTTVETAAITGQSLKVVEHYAKRRNNRELGKAGMAKWDRTKSEDRKLKENQ